MGFNVSWLAFHGVERSTLLSTLRLVATGEITDFPRGMECGSALPDTGYLLFLNDPWHPFTEPTRLAELSLACQVMVCRIEEHNMSSAAFRWNNGECVWSVVHPAARDVRSLKIGGVPPAELESIRVQATRLQDAERRPFFLGMLRAEMDHFFRVPIDLAGQIVGYEHDKVTQTWGKARYEMLRPGALQ
jgi:hypothetical protein